MPGAVVVDCICYDISWQISSRAAGGSLYMIRINLPFLLVLTGSCKMLRDSDNFVCQIAQVWRGAEGDQFLDVYGRICSVPEKYQVREYDIRLSTL